MRSAVMAFGARALLLVALSSCSKQDHPTMPAAQPAPFVETFDGSTLSATTWRTDIATSGVRWCSTVAGTLAAPGTWEDITQQQCNGALGTAPFGSIVVANGYASFSAASPGRGAFPYVWRGPPSRPSPVPENGDFELSVRLRFDEINVNGTGV